MSYRLGTMAFSSDTGLGNQTKSYCDNLKPHSVLAVDISSLNKKPIHKEWYSNFKTRWTKGIPTNRDCEWLVDNSDVILVAETPLNYHLFKYAKRKGVKTVLAFNYELLDYFQEPTLPYPDILAAPSQWHIDIVEQEFGKEAQVIYLPFPVDRDVLPFRQIKKINTFVHVSGGKLYEDRNGTELVYAAIPLVKNKDVRFIIYSQHEVPELNDSRAVVIQSNIKNYWELYSRGDCLILPRRYGGQTLQMNEAMATGMIPIMIACSPNNIILDQLCLVTPSGSKQIKTRSMIDCYTLDPRALAAKIDEFCELDETGVLNLNDQSDAYAESIAWHTLKPRYEQLFTQLCT